MRRTSVNVRPVRLSLGIASASMLFALGIFTIHGLARDASAGLAPPMATDYCIHGNGDGGAWTWTITTPSGDLTGAPAGVTGTAADVRDLFVDSIETARIGASQNFPLAAPLPPSATCVSPASRFEIVDVAAPTLSVSPPGGGAEVPVTGPDITAAVDFNPKIWIPVPEPGSTALFLTGALALAGLHRMRGRGCAGEGARARASADGSSARGR